MTELERKVLGALTVALQDTGYVEPVDAGDAADAVLRALADAEVRIVPAAEDDFVKVVTQGAKPTVQPPSYEQRVTALEKAKQLVPSSGGIGAARPTWDYLTVASWLLGEHDPSTWRGADD